MAEVNMSTEVRHSMRKKHKRRTRRRLLVLIIVIALAAVAVFGIRSRIIKNRTLSITEPFSLDEALGQSDLSVFSLQSLEGKASDLVTSDSEVGSDLVTLQADTERALLFNLDDKSAVYAHGIYDKIYPASLTKIMTALVCLDSVSMGMNVTMQEQDFEMDADAQESQLDAGDSLTMGDLLKLMLVYSANDAALAIARTVSGSTDAFVQKMNDKASELGMTGTHFVNPTGLHDDNHYTTPYDIYLMMNAANQYPEFSEYASAASMQVSVTGTQGTSSFTEDSTDEYLTGIYTLPQNVTIIASKTGTTDEAGSCLSLIVQNEYGVNYCAVVTGALDKDGLYGDMTQLLSLINS